MVDTHDHHKFLSKNRWRTKIFSNDEHATKKPETQANDNDVDDFLKPSTDRAQAHKQAAAAAFLANSKPRIDVARAQRWPSANEIISSGVEKSPAPGGLWTGRRKKALTVSFSRTQPDIIGEGGDECEEPSIEVFRRRKAHSLSNQDKTQLQTPQDDMNLGTRTFNSNNSTNREAERRGLVTRTLTSHAELSPSLQKKMEMGNINTHASPPLLPPRGLGPMGLGERPKSLQRAPTGFDVDRDSAEARPSLDSTYSYESGDISPATSRKAPSLAATVEEGEEDFTPRSLQRAGTAWSQPEPDSQFRANVARLPEMALTDDNSPQHTGSNAFLQSEPADPSSYSAQVIHKMRADEGRALHEAAARQALDVSPRDSSSSLGSFNFGPMQTSGFQSKTPPPQFTVPLAGKTPPRSQPREQQPQFGSAQLMPETEYDPYRSRPTRGPSPGRRPMPTEILPLDTEPRPPSSSSSHFAMPSVASRSHVSPTGPTDRLPPPATASLPQATSDSARIGYAATSSEQPSYPHGTVSSDAAAQHAVLPTPFGSEKMGYMESHHESTAQPPPHVQGHGQPSVPYRQAAGSEALPNVRRDPGPVPPSRSDTKSQAEAAFRDFSQRVQHMTSIFMLTAQLAGQLYEHTPMEWLRVASWWFLRGRAGMESQIRNRPKGVENQPERLTQPHVDLAKAWWIITDVIKKHPELERYSGGSVESQARLAREAGDMASVEVYEVHDIILSSMKMLFGSMLRHQSMPPTQALIQGQDQSIWVEYPTFAPDAHSVLTGTASRSVQGNRAGQLNPATLIPLGDTKTDFCYFRMFVNASLSTDDPNTDRVPLPAVISILRPRDEFKIKLSICSQTELINVAVGSDPDAGPTWRDVAWKSKTRGMNIQLRHGFNLNLELAEPDFRSLWAIVDHTNRVESNLRERSDERMCFRLHLRDFSYKDPTNPGAFPPERVRGCKLVVFQKFERSNEGTGRRKLHRGYRLVVVTNPNNRTLSCVNHDIGTKQEPMNFEYTTDMADSAPGLILRFKVETPDKKQKLAVMSMFFNDPKERNHLFGTFTSMNQGDDEALFAQVPLKAFGIENADQAEGFGQSGKDVLRRLQWMEAKALNQDPEAVGLEAAPTIMSESLRIVLRHSAGVISDRMNLGPGELLVRLSVDGAAELTLLRNPQQDMAIAIDASHAEQDVPEALGELLTTLTNASTIRKLTFNSFADLHAFQLAITGFQVIFDGIASTLSISRRRMVVPIYKQWTANTIRIQIVAQDNIVQLLAFFEDFTHADAMNFQLKSMDVFEKTDKGGKACVRLVDAKFALPVEERRGEGKMGREEGKISGWAGMKRRFVCLDQIEYPGEHDDILIGFDSKETRDRFAEALPAATQAGRKFAVRRKI